jgi:hypothetical protein
MDAGLTDRIWPCVHAWRCTLLALSGRHPRLVACPLSGVKRTSESHALMSAFDPKRTSKVGHETAPDSNFETGIASWGRALHLSRASIYRAPAR